jgi:TetR/AcrR family transcriptional regulator, cholesterol catabolism regulator
MASGGRTTAGEATGGRTQDVAAGTPDPEALNATQRARRQRIVRAALELLEAGSYDKVQVRDVAEAAGVALGTVYRYFSSKEHLFAAVLLEWAEPFATRVRRAPDAGADDAERLTAALHRALSAFEHRPQYFQLVTVLEVVPDPVVADTYARFTRSTQGALRESLHDVPPEDVDAVTRLAGAVLDSTLRAWSLGRMPAAEARANLARAVRLVFSGPPQR